MTGSVVRVHPRRGATALWWPVRRGDIRLARTAGLDEIRLRAARLCLKLEVDEAAYRQMVPSDPGFECVPPDVHLV
jgi:hypothetical protein